MKLSPESQGTVLLVDHNAETLELTRLLLQDAGICKVLTLADSQTLIPFLERHPVSLIVLKPVPELNGADTLDLVRRDYPHIPVIIENATTDVETAIKYMKSGAFDYLVKPTDPCRLILAVKNALDFDDPQQEATTLKEYLLTDRLEYAEAFSALKTVSRKMRSIFQYTEVVARSPQPVLISGETGVGKELFAQAIHKISGVRGMFVSINVAGLDDAMFSDTLFGHKKGAFTGADQVRDGLVNKAGSGTLFLDEIGDLNELSQVKLLRLLQEREYYPVGADLVRTSTARIVLATNVDLPSRIKEGRFRRDLYFRLCTHQIRIPPLRERAEDIPLLFDTFMAEAEKQFGRSIPGVAGELRAALAEYDFPGNVRELQAKVNDAVARHEEGRLSLADFPGIPAARPAQSHATTTAAAAETGGIYSLFGRLPTFREIEDYLILEALKVSEGNFASAASILGVTRQTISKRLKMID